jgi:hypothetical protein
MSNNYFLNMLVVKHPRLLVTQSQGFPRLRIVAGYMPT